MVLKEIHKKLIMSAVVLIVSLLSVFVAEPKVLSWSVQSGTVEYLDEKQTTVMEISAAAAAASAAVTMLPGDSGTPIAEKLSDISMYSLVILCAIFLEKYLVTITGVAAFKYLIPAAGVILLINIWILRSQNAQKLGLKLAAFAAAIFLVIPVSVRTSRLIEETYDTSIAETLEQAKEDTAQIENNSTNQTLWEKFLETIEGGISGITDKFEVLLSNFIEATAVMVVTSCIIPILILMFFVWIIKMIFQIDIPLPGPRFRRPEKPQEEHPA